MAAKIGDKVKLVNEPGEGVITAVLPDGKVHVEIDGFEYTYPVGEIIVLHAADPNQAWYGASEGNVLPRPHDVTRVVVEPDEAPRFIPKKGKTNHTNLGYREVDLHIQNLVEQHEHLTNGEMLQIQLAEFERHLRSAMKYHEKKVVFIHGIGEGVLRQELRNRLKAYSGVEYHDASFHLYGYGGATEVVIY